MDCFSLEDHRTVRTQVPQYLYTHAQRSRVTFEPEFVGVASSSIDGRAQSSSASRAVPEFPSSPAGLCGEEGLRCDPIQQSQR